MVIKITLAFTLFLLFSSFPNTIHAAFIPPARLTFTFDDSNDRIFKNALPILNQHNFPAVEYAENALLDSGEDWVMTWDQISDLQNQYNWEIGSHSINHPNLTTVTPEQLENEVVGSLNSFRSHGLAVNSFSTPYGAFNNTVIKKISQHYTTHRAAWGGPNVWSPIYNDYQLVVYEVKHDISVETVMTWIDDAVAHNQWLILLLHDIVDGTATEYTYNKDDFKKVVDYAASRPIKVVTMSQGLKLSDNPNLINNSSFEEVDGAFVSDWTRNRPAKVTLDNNSNGNAPSPHNSIKIVGSNLRNEIKTSSISINGSTDYIFKLFADGINYTNGSWVVAIDEKRSDGSTIRTKRLWTVNKPFIGTHYISYTPGSNEVSSIQIRIFSVANSNLTLYIDSVELRIAKNDLPVPTLTPTNAPSPSPTLTPTIFPSPTLTPVPTITPPVGENLLSNGSFEELTENGYAVFWERNDINAIKIDTSNNGSNPSPKNSLSIIGGLNQYTAISPVVDLPDSSATYSISYFEKTNNFQQGGTATWVDEFDVQNNYLSGQWLGGKYTAVNELVAYDYKPTSTNVKYIQVHLFTEINSVMSVYYDEIKVVKK